MKKIRSIRDAQGKVVAISQIAAAEPTRDGYEITLKCGVKVTLKEMSEDGKLESNLRGQLDMFFTS